METHRMFIITIMKNRIATLLPTMSTEEKSALKQMILTRFFNDETSAACQRGLGLLIARTMKASPYSGTEWNEPMVSILQKLGPEQTDDGKIKSMNLLKLLADEYGQGLQTHETNLLTLLKGCLESPSHNVEILTSIMMLNTINRSGYRP